jgi:hypothetical protein
VKRERRPVQDLGAISGSPRSPIAADLWWDSVKAVVTGPKQAGVPQHVLGRLTHAASAIGAFEAGLAEGLGGPQVCGLSALIAEANSSAEGLSRRPAEQSAESPRWRAGVFRLHRVAAGLGVGTSLLDAGCPPTRFT